MLRCVDVRPILDLLVGVMTSVVCLVKCLQGVMIGKFVLVGQHVARVVLVTGLLLCKLPTCTVMGAMCLCGQTITALFVDSLST